MQPIQIQTSGQLVIFKSKSAFLDLLGYSKTYTQTPHYKLRYPDETPQKLWNRVKNARQKLEQLMATYSPAIDPETGVKSYRHGKVLVCPVGYVPPPLREDVTLDPSGTDNTSIGINHTPVASQSNLTELLAARIAEEIEILVKRCEAEEGKEAAELLRASITEVTIGVKSVSGNAEHFLVRYFDECLFGQPRT